MLVFAGTASGRPKVRPKMYFYRLEKRRWYTAPYKGDVVGWYGNLNNSPHYDPELKLLVRLSHFSRKQLVEVVVMRLVPQTLELSPLQ